MWICPKCKEECEESFDSCWNCSTGRDGAPSAEPLKEKVGMASSQPSGSKGSRQKLMSRYADSYLVARTITAFGAIVKFIAFIIGGGIILVSIIIGSQSTPYILGGILLAVIVGFPVYVLGVLVAAQGQILKATLDTAVNSSPLLTKDEMRQIMSLD
jgi:hypothetical protein